jgi:PBSX family phage terminase large subunit
MNIKKIFYRPSKKARDVWKNAHKAKFRLLAGAVRSSKSHTADTIALKEIQALPEGSNILISGYSISSVARNVLAEWRLIIDPFGKGVFKQIKDGKDDHLQINWRGLRGKKFYIRGAGKENDFKQIQGATFAYWYADELTRHMESFFDMAMTRLSLPYSLGLWTCNPDSPLHYVKKRIIDDEKLFIKDKKGFSLYAFWQFELDDNTSLTQRYKDGLKAIFSGVLLQEIHPRIVGTCGRVNI